jgi:sorting nexin-1/2
MALLHEIQVREVNMHRLRMIPGSETKAYSTEMSLQRYHAAANLAREEYAECSQRVLREVDRFKREKAEEMKVIVLQIIQLEIDVNRSIGVSWCHNWKKNGVLLHHPPRKKRMVVEAE